MPDPHATLKETAARFQSGRQDLDSLAESAERLRRDGLPGMKSRAKARRAISTRLLRLAQHPSVREAKAEK